MTSLVFLLWGVLSSSPAVDSTADDRDLCDDDATAWDAEGWPNWACTIEGCTPHEQICWDHRLDDCYDEDGNDRGTCAYHETHCHTRLECFNLWVHCEGSYECHSDTAIGCTDGTCTTASQGEDGGEVFDPHASSPI